MKAKNEITSSLPSTLIQSLRKAKRYLVMEANPSAHGNTRNQLLFAKAAKDHNLDLQSLFDAIKL